MPPPGAADALPMDIYLVSEREAGDGAATPERARFTAGHYYVFCYREKLKDPYAGRTHPPQPPRIRTPYTLSALIAVVEIVPTATPLARVDTVPVPFATADYGQTPPMPNAVPIPAATYGVPWYTVDADFYAMRTAYGWQHLPLPVGTAETHRGRAGMIGWSETHGAMHASMGATGIHFYPEGLDGVAVPVEDPNGPSVRLAQFRRPDTKDGERQRYVTGRAYVFCFDRPLANAIPPRAATPGAPADTVELAQALPFLTGVVEVRPTFVLVERAATAPLADLTTASFRSFAWRLYGAATFDFTWTQDADGARTTQLHVIPHRADARERPFTEDQRDQLVYLLGAAPWEPTRAIGRPPANTHPVHVLTYSAADGTPTSAEIQMEVGRWWLVMPDGRHFWARCPEDAVEALKRPALGTRDPWE